VFVSVSVFEFVFEGGSRHVCPGRGLASGLPVRTRDPLTHTPSSREHEHEHAHALAHAPPLTVTGL